MNYEKIINKINKEKGLIGGEFVNEKGEHCAVGCLLSKDLQLSVRENKINSVEELSYRFDDNVLHLSEFGTKEELNWIQSVNDRCGNMVFGLKNKDRKNIVIACLYARKTAEENGENVRKWRCGYFANSSFSKKEYNWFENFIRSIINEGKKAKIK